MDKYQQLITDYCYENELAEGTLRSYLKGLEKYKDIFGYEFSKENMVSYKKYLLDNFSPKTANIRLQTMNRLMELIDRPKFRVKQVKIQQKNHVENVITEREYKKLCRKLLEDGNQTAYWRIQFLAKTGARVSELIQFRKEHLIAGEMILWSKGKVKTIHIPKDLISEAKCFFDEVESDWLFPSRTDSSKHISTRGVSQMLINLAERYGIRKEVMHAHSFRHFFAIQMMKSTKDLTLVSDLLGHSSISTTQIYTRMSKEDQRKKVDRAITW
ncbi:tyrosine-type recombinase/integrase [Enterococcus asini]|uniref:tyrosine-type recombinase/integrase n=1 Tax=Enterococcus asini TaxID=57732 RepID=UPI00266B6E52|nr:tyrosine-type recombinase/integrase [Enterococcus asini]